MASRTGWFKEFVRNLDKKAHYEDVKDLALNQAKHDMSFEDKARHARLVVAEKLHQEREML